MLHYQRATVSFSVDDLAKAKTFYSETLGLDVAEMDGMLQLNLADNYLVWVYSKSDHRPAAYTVLNFTVEDLGKAMSELMASGVTFEHYDLPGAKTDEKGVVDYGMMKIAFFNDPAGNNHAVLQMTQ